ncbi:uncharacterized protein LOC135477619 [Liolophura sinensis]|uniref:uncharacterized protein LOC135477619 n=1 Tax=Liolophura sinensis TaxID=3198878 RepID=UPI0031581CC2
MASLLVTLVSLAQAGLLVTAQDGVNTAPITTFRTTTPARQSTHYYGTTTTIKTDPGTYQYTTAMQPPQTGTGNGFAETTRTPTEDNPEEIFNEKCSQQATISQYCVLPQELKDFLSPDATLTDIGAYMFSEDIVGSLISECKAGEYCLNSETSEALLEEKLTFWTNASDFDMLCWPDLSICLDYISDFYFDCEIYETYNLVTDMNTLLCKMKEEPKASPECIKETIKSLHVSLADSKRSFEELEASSLGPECDSRKSRMAKNFLCTAAMCDKYSAVLYEFHPWKWISDSIEDLKSDCSLESLECVSRANEETMDDILSSMIKDEEKVYEKNWMLETFDMRAVIVIAIVSVAALGALSLVILTVWRKRKMRVRVRDGMEYLEIKPEETDAFLEGLDEIGDTTKLVPNH